MYGNEQEIVIIQLLGTSLINRLMSPPFLGFIAFKKSFKKVLKYEFKDKVWAKISGKIWDLQIKIMFVYHENLENGWT